MRMEGHNISTLENSDLENKGAHVERRLREFPNVEKSDKNESLKLAQEELLENESLYKKFLRGIVEVESKNATTLASVENIFIQYCQDLSDTEIDSIVRQFNSGLRKYVIHKKGSLSITQSQFEQLLSAKSRNINSRGIIQVVQFMRVRKKILNLVPAQEYSYHFDDILDARYKIDLIESIYTPDGNIDIMNLIQIKSSEPSSDEIASIVKSHRDWITSSVMDLDMFEKEYIDGIPEGLKIEELSQNAESVGDLLLEMCTSPEGFDSESFIRELDLEKLNNKHKAWLLIKYGKSLKEKIGDAVVGNNITEIEANELIITLENLENSVRAKARIPRNLIHVNQINSIVTVGINEVKKVELSQKGLDVRKKKVLKVD